MEPQPEHTETNTPPTPALSPEEAELRAAHERLAEAKRQKALADEQKLIAARTALAQRQAAEERALAEQRETQRLIEEKWAAKRKAEEDAREAEQRKAVQEKLDLENLLAAQELAKQKREAHEKEILQLSDEAFALEQAARQAEADALRAPTPTLPEPEISIHSPGHPLSKIFGVTQPVVTPERTPVLAQDPVQAPELRKENGEERSLLLSAFINKGLRVNPATIINLSLRHEPEPIVRALETVTADARLQGAYAVQAIETLLWNPEEDPEGILNSVVAAREAEKSGSEAEKAGRI